MEKVVFSICEAPVCKQVAAVDAAATTAAAGCQRVTRCPTGRPTPPPKKAGKTKKGRKKTNFGF